MIKKPYTIRDHNQRETYTVQGEEIHFDGIEIACFIAKHPLANVWGVYEKSTGLYIPAPQINKGKKECIKATHDVLKQVGNTKLNELVQRALEFQKLNSL